MASAAFTDLVALTALAVGDVFAAVDISDSTQSPQGSLKQITMTNVIAGLGLATLPNITTGTINGQTVSATASFTGTVAVASTLGVTGAVTLSSTLHTVGVATFDAGLVVGSTSAVAASITWTGGSLTNGGSVSFNWNSADKGFIGSASALVTGGVNTDLAIRGENAVVLSIGTTQIAKVTSAGLTSTAFSGPLTGDVTGNVTGSSGSTTGNASTATKLATARTIAITGDLAYTSAAFDGSGNVTGAGTLATVNVNVGSFGSTTAIPVITVDGKGRVTAVATAAVVAPAGTVTGTTLAANVVTSSLTTVGALASGSITSGFGAINIGTNALTAGAAVLGGATLDDASHLSRINTATPFTLAAGGTTRVLATGLSATSSGLLILTGTDSSSNVMVTFVLIGHGQTSSYQVAAPWSSTKDTASDLNVYVLAGSLTIQNNYAFTVTLVPVLFLTT